MRTIYDGKIILGDLNRQSLEDILRGERFRRLRDAHKNGDFSEFPFCSSCDQLNRREDVLVYTNIKDVKVDTTNTGLFALKIG